MAIDSRLFMEIGIVNTSFQAIDRTPYERWINDGHFDNDHSHAVLQRLLIVKDGDDNQVKDKKLVVADTIEKLRNPWEVKNITNGLYYYQKMVLPTIDHITNANETLWYDEAYNKVFYFDYDSQVSVEFDPWNDFDEIYSILRKEYPDNCFYFDDYTFSIYGLVECYVMTERERINNYLRNNCQGNCSKGINDIDARADILLAAIMVLKDLMKKGEFFEAQRILNGLNTCGNLCKKYMNNLKGCGCGGA